MRVLNDVCDLMEQELKEAVKKGAVSSPQEMDSIHHAVETIYYATVTEAMKDSGYSNTPYYDRRMYDWSNGRNSYEGGRDRNSYGDYSRDDGMKREIEELKRRMDMMR